MKILGVIQIQIKVKEKKNSLLIMESLICLLNIMFLWLTLKDADITHSSMGTLHSYMNLIDCT